MGNQDVKDAFSAGDYSSFVENASDRLLEKIDSEESFKTMAELYQKKQTVKETMQADLLEAVKNNDLAAFKQVRTDAKTSMESLRETFHGNDKDGEAKERPEPTAEQLAEKEVKQTEKFQELVTYYQENGTLPERSMKRWFGKKGMKGFWKRHGEEK